MTNQFLHKFPPGTWNAVLRNLIQHFCLKCEIIPIKFGRKLLNSLFHKQFLTPTFCSRNEKSILWNASRQKLLKVWKRSAQHQNKSWRQFFFLGKHSSNNVFWSRTTQIGEDCRNVYLRRVEEFSPKFKKNDKNIVFFSKKTFVVHQNLGPLEPCFANNSKHISFLFWYLQKPPKIGINYTEKTSTKI